MGITQLQFDKVFSSLFAGSAAPQVQVVEVTVAIPQLHRVRHPHVVDIRVVAQRQVPLVLLVHADHRASSFAVHGQGGLRPCWAGRASFVMLAQGVCLGPCTQVHGQG